MQGGDGDRFGAEHLRSLQRALRSVLNEGTFVEQRAAQSGGGTCRATGRQDANGVKTQVLVVVIEQGVNCLVQFVDRIDGDRDLQAALPSAATLGLQLGT